MLKLYESWKQTGLSEQWLPKIEEQTMNWEKLENYNSYAYPIYIL